MDFKKSHIEQFLDFEDEKERDFVIKKDSDLSKQVRNMLVLNPIIRLEFLKNSLGPSDSNLFDGIDTQYLCFSLFDFISENMVFNPGGLRKDIIEYLAFEAIEIKQDLSDKEAFEIGEIVLDYLSNSRENHKAFSFSYFDAKDKISKKRSFRLINYTISEDGSGYYFLTRDGFAAYLSMYFTDSENISEMDEFLVKKMLERENFDGALKIAKRNRKRTIEYKKEHDKTLLKIKKDINSIDWNTDIKPFLERSRKHIQERLDYEGEMLQKLDTYLDRDDFKDISSMTILQETIQECQRRHGDLHRTLIDYNEQFLDEQVRSFRANKISSEIKDFEKDILEKSLGLSLQEINLIANDITSSLNVTNFPNIFDPLQIISLFEKSLNTLDDEFKTKKEDLQILNEKSEIFTKDMIEKVDQFLKNEAKQGKTTLEQMVRKSVNEGFSDDEIKCLSYLLLQYFGDSELNFKYLISKSGKFKSAHITGDNFLIRTNNG
ncbi:MAG: hypothetical protein GY714_24525 [Desulfobacterales bacterium]|nr:hypothetical protein [Desulfobacterales bacterium]